ncbi:MULTISPECIES: dihydrofolate reductase [Methylosinus]|uniref:Dihydrofolate reductase n=1 Tax=Methylosinus trichosporium (strain ATCC 35070 / NCIMB 11131 / UNIQEM 75 / OB3b) TaxID=595536 RepID=A0A2D2D4R7_METT3|nr:MULTISPECIES: dihydrofolate reductase [Methylosinus]ATQ69963.1 dihydrofolate reductase [Methylosinus trichosporium OB3b]OBS51119.1 diacylglycerol kinase [Methylosinus sp. 3S-1]
MTPTLTFVVAAARNGVIGARGRTPWRLPTDLKRFRELTWGKPLLMGRRTFDSIGRLLPGRETLVLSRDPSFHPAGAHVARTPQEALRHAESLALAMGAQEAAVAGGAEIFAAFLPLADVIHLTEVALTVEGDAIFPALDPREWRETERLTPPRAAEDEADCAFVRLERTSGREAQTAVAGEEA